MLWASYSDGSCPGVPRAGRGVGRDSEKMQPPVSDGEQTTDLVNADKCLGSDPETAVECERKWCVSILGGVSHSILPVTPR